ncbi:MAG: hypothetical protein GF317_14810 [Candidatus Lokiarchaeota archaeon]|nr:hypothetical protein [Candidatus Lokiarchaeota archaeon]
MQLFKSVTPSSAGVSTSVVVPPGTYSHFYFRFDADASAAETITRDIGRIRLNLNGKEIVNLDFDLLQFINDLEGGYPEAVQNEGGVCSYTALLPAFYKDMENVFYVGEDDRLVIYFNYNSTQIDKIEQDDSFQIGGIHSRGQQTYWRTMFQEIPNLINGTSPETFEAVENLVSLYYNNSNITRILMEVDGEVIVNAEAETIQSISNILNQKEASYSSIYKIDLTQGNSIGKLLSDEIKITFTTSDTDTPDLVFNGIMFDDRRLTKSRNSFLNQYTRRVRRKVGKGSEIPAEIKNAPIIGQPQPVPMPSPEPPLT